MLIIIIDFCMPRFLKYLNCTKSQMYVFKWQLFITVFSQINDFNLINSQFFSLQKMFL